MSSGALFPHRDCRLRHAASRAITLVILSVLLCVSREASAAAPAPGAAQVDAAVPTKLWAPTRPANDAPAGVAPVNLAPNSQWEIWSGVGYGPRETREGVGVMAPIPSIANSTGSNRVVFTVGPTGELKIGDLITVTGVGIDPGLSVSPLRGDRLAARCELDGRAAFRPASLSERAG